MKLKQYKIIDNADGFLDLKGKWSNLYNNYNNSTSFQSFDFCYLSWKHLLQKNKKNKLAVYVFYNISESNTEDIFCIFPFYIDSNRTLRFINDIHSDYCDGLIPDGNNNDLFATLSKAILGDSKIREVRLINLRASSPVQAYLRYHFVNNSLVISETQHSYLFIEKTKNFPDNLRHLDSSKRSELRRIRKKTENLTCQNISIENLEFPSIDIRRLRDSLVSNNVRDSSYIDDDFLCLIEDLYNAGVVSISCVIKEERTIGATIVFNRGLYSVFWIDLFEINKKERLIDNYSLLLLYLREESPRRDFTLSLGRGTNSYKMTNYYPEIENLYTFYAAKSRYKLFFESLRYLVIDTLRPAYRKMLKPAMKRLGIIAG